MFYLVYLSDNLVSYLAETVNYQTGCSLVKIAEAGYNFNELTYIVR